MNLGPEPQAGEEKVGRGGAWLASVSLGLESAQEKPATVSGAEKVATAGG